MLPFGKTLPDDATNQWRYQLDQFVKANQSQLAALAWGFRQEWADTNNSLGIDLKPQPHFIRCTRDALEKLNQQVDNQLQEILGILDGYNPETEVVIITVGEGQVKLIHFEANPSPPECFNQFGTDMDGLIATLETELQQKVTLA